VTLISLGFWIDIRPFQDQVSPPGAEIAEGDFSSAPIGRRRLEQKLRPFGIKINSV
jgi:hypothetical protein